MSRWHSIAAIYLTHHRGGPQPRSLIRQEISLAPRLQPGRPTVIVAPPTTALHLTPHSPSVRHWLHRDRVGHRGTCLLCSSVLPVVRLWQRPQVHAEPRRSLLMPFAYCADAGLGLGHSGCHGLERSGDGLRTNSLPFIYPASFLRSMRVDPDIRRIVHGRGGRGHGQLSPYPR